MTETDKTAWRRVLIEAAAIVGSILLAFAIDAWWEDRQARLLANSHILSVAQELELISGRLERSIRLAKVAEDAATTWLDNASGLPPETLNSLLGDMVMWATADVVSPSMQALVNSDVIDLIEDSELRTWILEFPTQVQDFVEEENGSIAFVDAAFVPYLADHSVSLGNADPLGMGFKGRAPQDNVLVLVDDWGFEALVVWRATKARDVFDSANKLVSVIDEGRELIKEEIENLR